MGEGDAVPWPVGTYRLNVPEAKYTVQVRISGQLPWRHISLVMLILGWALCFQVPLTRVLLALILLDVVSQQLPIPEMLQIPPQYLSFSMMVPAEQDEAVLSAKALQRMDEQAYVRAGLVCGATNLIAAAQTMDQALNDALSAIQEVELVSRRFPLSSPLPPISRIEASWSFDEHGLRQGMFPPRLMPVRKTMADALDEACFHCRAVCERLKAVAEQEEAERVRELMMLRQHAIPVDVDTFTSQSPRPLALVSSPRATHTPDKKRPRSRFSHTLLTPGSSPMQSRRSVGDETLYTSYDRARQDRLSLASLRTQFEAMHVERQTILYYLLSLNMDMSRARKRNGMAIEAPVYWDDEILHGVLKYMASHFHACAKQVRSHLNDEMSLPGLGREEPSSTAVDLSEHLIHMGQLLRTLQCKMKVCMEEGTPVPALHGSWPPITATDPDAAPAMFESMKEELLALSAEWEAGMRRLATPSPPSAPFTPLPYVPPTISPPSPTKVRALWEAKEETEFLSGAENSETLDDVLLASSTPASLPSPDSEEVFECEPRALPPRTRPTLSRTERISLRKQERDARDAKTDDVQPLEMVSELKSVLQRRTHSLPTHRVGPPTA